MDAAAFCSDCHSSDATIVAIEQQFAMSPHGFGNFEVRHRGSCDACHTSQGFVAAATGTEADFTGGAASMSCRTCHQIHTEFDGDDYALYVTEAVGIMVNSSGNVGGGGADHIVDAGGSSNTCASCHQVRPEDVWPDYTAPLTQMFTISSTHFDLHHGPQTNWFFGEIPESFTFGETADDFGPHSSVSCVGCHMGLGVDGLDSPEPVPGGELFHTFRPAEDVCATCHDGDFNYGDVREDVMAMLDDLGACLEAEGVTEDGHPVVGDHPEPYVAAYLVWQGASEDGSYGTHQPRFVPDVVEAALAYMEANSLLCPVVQ